MTARLLILLLLLATFFACGGGPSPIANINTTPTPPTTTTAGNNVVPITVNSGPAGVGYVNGAFVSVTVCVPGSSNCQTVDNVLVDTGSEGLRIVSSALTLSLPQVNATVGGPLAECNQFIDGYTWGPIRQADIKIAGETASAAPMQLIGDPGFTSIPNACTSTGPSENTVQSLGANGILGIGPFRQDCGGGCTLLTSQNPGLYYSCPSGANCTQTQASLTQQAQNPVWMFPTDNNGVLIQLPTVAAAGQPSSTGSLIFGIGTQTNNALGSAQVLTLDNNGNFTTVFNGTSYPGSFIDSGSNGFFFLDAATTGIPTCPKPDDGFYCPTSTQALSATNRGTNGVSSAVQFSVANAQTLFANTPAFVYGNLAGPNAGAFDWGLPFFYGRNVFTAIELQNTSAGVGPYFAY